MVQTRTGIKTGVISVEDYVAYIMKPGRTLRGDKVKPPTPEHLYYAKEMLQMQLIEEIQKGRSGRQYQEILRLLPPYALSYN